MNESIPDCRKCGACCSMRWSWPVLRRDRSDAAGIPRWMQCDGLPLMRTNNGRCVALAGKVGSPVECSIYVDRPAACRAFVPGGMLCLEARKKFGMQECGMKPSEEEMENQH
ncbi:MAG: YkgJ family cysteine cluster protein [Verrucomicrobiae bacterium]